MSHHLLQSRHALVAPILRLQPEIGGMFVEQMDLLTVTRWRRTCKTNYDQSAAALRRALLSILRPFVPFPSKLLDIVTASRGLFGGEVALSFILRDPLYTTGVLEIYSTEYDFRRLCDDILADPDIRGTIEAHNYTSSTLLFALRRLIAQTLTIHLKNGKTIYVHRSYTASAAAPLTRTPCTALSNFVTAYSFGCSHPMLTLDRRALLADQEIPFLHPLDAMILNNLLRHRFSMAVSPAAWPEFRRVAPSDDEDGVVADSSYPLHPISTLKGFVAGDEDAVRSDGLANADDFAFNVGIAQAIYGEAALVGFTGVDEVSDAVVGDSDTSGVATPPVSSLGPGQSNAGSTPLPSVTPVTESGALGGQTPCPLAATGCECVRIKDVAEDLEEGEIGCTCALSEDTGLVRFESAGTSLTGQCALHQPPSPVLDPVHSPLIVDGAVGVHEPPQVNPDGDVPDTHPVHDNSEVDSPAPASDHSDADGEEDVVVGCWRDLYLCPSQGRYFGDRGSFVDFLDPLRRDEDKCVERGIAPYGAMVVWRLMSTFDCEEGCEYFDDVLEEGVTSIPVMFKCDPFGELRDIVSDRYTGESGHRRSTCRPRSSSV